MVVLSLTAKSFMTKPLLKFELHLVDESLPERNQENEVRPNNNQIVVQNQTIISEEDPRKVPVVL